MKPLNLKRCVGLLAIGLISLWAVGPSPALAKAKAPAVDPAAVQILKRMTTYLGALKQFSVKTQNTIEDLTDSGHRVDYDVSSIVTVKRPNKLKAQRMGDLIDQTFFYNGNTLTLYNASDRVYATEPAPKTIEGMLEFARSSLGLIIPAADLIYRDNFKLLMQNVTFATVIGKEFIDGVQCDHLLFSRPGVDFQVCVADRGNPLPYKYVVTDTSTCALISISTVMSDWNTAPSVNDAFFDFVPSKGVEKISFMPLKTEDKTGR